MNALLQARWFRVLLAALIAFVCWIFVVNQGFRTATETIQVPVEVYNTPVNLIVSSPLPHVEVQVRAPRTVAMSDVIPTVFAFVDGAQLGTGEHTLELQAGSTHRSAEIISMSLTQVTITLETVSVSERPVEARIEGVPADQFSVGEVTGLPESVAVSGPRSFVDRVVRVEVPVSVADAVEDVLIDAPYEPVDAEGTRIPNVTIDAATPSGRVAIVEAQQQRVVSIRPRVSGSVPSGYEFVSVSANPSAVTLEGDDDVLASLTSVQTDPIELSVARGSFERRVSLAIPEGVRVVDGENSILVSVQVRERQASRVLQVPAQITVRDEALRVASVEPRVLSVVVSGSQLQLDALQPSSVEVRKILQGLAAGEHVVTLSQNDIIAPNGVVISSFEPTAIRVTLEALE